MDVWKSSHGELTGNWQNNSCNQGCIRDTHAIGYNVKTSDWVSTCAPGTGLREKRSHGWILALVSEKVEQ